MKESMPMQRKRDRKLLAAPPAVLFLLLALRATPSDPATPSKGQMQSDAAERLARRQLAMLIAGGPLPSWGFALFSAGDVAAALGGQTRSLGLFAADSAVDRRDRLLRGLPYGAILAAAEERNHVDALLLAAVVEAESQFAPHAVSPCGAVGLMQLLPATGEAYGIKNLRDPTANVEAGSRYLQDMLARFRGRPDLALAAYNTGPEVVARYGCVPPYRETQDFVKRVLSRYAFHRQAVERQASPISTAALAGRPDLGVAAATPKLLR
jgi:soluble lytic murein transglycosylase-like protein